MQKSGAIDFSYDPGWLAWEHALPVSLSLTLREDRYIGDPVIAVFDNLLPDSDRIRRRTAERVGAGGADTACPRGERRVPPASRRHQKISSISEGDTSCTAGSRIHQARSSCPAACEAALPARRLPQRI
jgi:hypothetical protein